MPSLAPMRTLKLSTKRKCLVDAISGFVSTLKPPPDISMADWVEENRSLPADSAAEPGKLSLSRAEYQREWLNAAQCPETHEITIMACSQSGKSETELSIIAWYMAEDPSPILVALPTQGNMEDYSKERLTPMIDSCKPLEGKVSDARSRDGDNTLRSKKYPGGRISMTASHSPAGLCARPIRVAVADEIDRWPASAGSEGDPLDLLGARLTTFFNWLFVKISSPTVAGQSRIEKSFKEGTQEYFHVPCPKCGHMQELIFENLRWETFADNEGKKRLVRGSEYYMCSACSAHWSNEDNDMAVRKGAWVATFPERTHHRSFHISALASPWVSFVKLIEKWLNVQGDTERLKTFVNTMLARLFEEQAEALEEAPLYERRESYDAREVLPPGVVLITAAVDTHDDNLDLEIKGWGRGRESWSLERIILHGDPSVVTVSYGRPSVWMDLDAILERRRYNHPCGAVLRIAATAIDSGGHNTDAVYQFCMRRWARRVWAVKGSSTREAPIWPGRPSKNNSYGCPLFLIGTNTAKDLIHSDLGKADPGPGYVHHPNYPQDFFKQLAGEKRVRKRKTGRWYTCWVPRPGRENHALDLHVYNLAVLEGLHVDLDVISDNMRVPGVNVAAVTGRPIAVPKLPQRAWKSSKTYRAPRRR